MFRQGMRLVTRIALCGRACLGHVCNHTLKAGPGPAQSILSLVLGEGAGIITPISLTGEPRLRGVKRDTGSPTASTSWSRDLKGPVPQQGLRGAPVETIACPASLLPHHFSPSHQCSGHTDFLRFLNRAISSRLWALHFVSSAWNTAF